MNTNAASTMYTMLIVTSGLHMLGIFDRVNGKLVCYACAIGYVSPTIKVEYHHQG